MKQALKYFCLSLLTLCVTQAQGQKKIAFDFGLSLNTTTLSADNKFELMDAPLKQKVRPGFHLRAITQSNGLFNLSLGTGLIFKNFNDNNSFGRNQTITDLNLNIPLLLHTKIYKRLQIQAGLSYDVLLYRKTSGGRERINSSDTPKIKRFAPTVGLTYKINNSFEFNLNYYKSEFTDNHNFYGPDICIILEEFNEHHLQFSAFFTSL